MSATIAINSRTPRTLQIAKPKDGSYEILYIDLHLSELTQDERVKIAAWALQDCIIK